MDSDKLSPEVIGRFESVVGKDNVKEASGGCGECCCSGASIVVCPSSVEEVAAVMRIAKEEGVCSKEFKIDLSANMNKIIKVDAENFCVKVQAGASMEAVAAAADEAGFILGNRTTCEGATIGCLVYSNGADIGTYRFGPIRDNVLNLEVVLPNGTVIETGYDDISAYMSGYNLNQLMVGAEGTLGQICTVTLRMYPKAVIKPLLFNYADLKEAAPLISGIANHASLRPLYVCWADEKYNSSMAGHAHEGCKNTVLVVLHGDERIVEAEEAEVVKLAAGAEKLSDDMAAHMWSEAKTYDCCGAIIPAKCFAAFAGIASDLTDGAVVGQMVDPQTVLFSCVHKDGKCNCKMGAKAAEFGGRPAKIGNTFDADVIDEAALGLMKDIRCAIVGNKAPANERLSREVTPEIISELEAAVGKDNVNIGPEERLLYSHDLAPLPGMAGIAFKNIPDVVVRPTSTKDVAKVMAIAYAHGIAVTPRGNSTWGLGGSQPINAGIVIDFSSKMNKVIKVDPENLCIKVQAGITFKEALDAAEAQGFVIGSHPSSYPAATIGGWMGTNGMGVGTYKYGSVKDNILNSEIVLPDGRIVETGYDEIGDMMSGYNLNQYLAGAEGTLGLLCTVTMKLHPRGVVKPTIYNFENLADADYLIQAICAHPSIKPYHISWADFNHFENQRRARAVEPKVHVFDECKNTLLLVLQGEESIVDVEDMELEELAILSGGTRLPDEIAEHEWEERCYEFRARAVGVGEIPAEVIVPAKYWGTFVGECYKAFDTMKMDRGGIIGNAVDPNTVLFMPYYFMDNESMMGMTAFSFNFHVGDLAVKYGGRTTGLGVFFAWNLDNIHDANTVALMREMKTALDPRDVMNPGHVVCGLTRFGITLSHGLMEFASTLLQTVKKVMPQDTTFSDNIARFRYNTLEERKAEDRRHVLGRGYE